jgi:hypothetical protein
MSRNQDETTEPVSEWLVSVHVRYGNAILPVGTVGPYPDKTRAIIVAEALLGHRHGLLSQMRRTGAAAHPTSSLTGFELVEQTVVTGYVNSVQSDPARVFTLTDALASQVDDFIGDILGADHPGEQKNAR